MKIKSFEVGPFAENTYLLVKGKEALLIDPGFSGDDEFKAFKRELATTGAALKAVLLTHAHIDHLLGLPAVLDTFKVDVFLNHTDLHPWKNIAEQAAMFGLRAQNLDFLPKSLPNEGPFTVGAFEMDLLFTPGHSPDHVSIYFKDQQLVIAGDTLFRQSVGRTDLYKGDSDLLKESITQKLYTLPDETVVYPGHGPKTSIGEEKKTNPFVRG
jgi:glyoxylase-like metal-dependent hydrolase (beta-lactamase superfamily II)